MNRHPLRLQIPLLICLALFPFLSLNAQVHNGIHDTMRVKTIIDIADMITWPQGASIEKYRFGVLGKHPDLVKELEDQAQRRSVHGKPIEVLHFWDPDALDTTAVHLLFLQRRDGYDISKVQGAIEGESTLLIAENYPFYQSMISFVFHERGTHYYVFRKRFLEKGFSYKKALERLAEVKTQADWKRAYKETEDELVKMRKEVEEQETELERMKAEVAEKEERLEEQEASIRRQERLLREKRDSLGRLKGSVLEQKEELRRKRKELQKKARELDSTRKATEKARAVLEEQKSAIDSQEARLQEQRQRIDRQEGTLRAKEELITYQRAAIYLFIALLLIILASAYLLYRSNRRIKNINNELEEKNRTILDQNERIEDKNQEITESITYASRIQRAMLPSLSLLEESFSGTSTLYIPRDIVSGDFYWAGRSEDRIVWTAADCTGHGVPGAMMSMLGMAYLKEVVTRKGTHEADQVLNELRDMIVRSLSNEEEGGQTMDGMDMGLCSWDGGEHIEFAGANNPLYIIHSEATEDREYPEGSRRIEDDEGRTRGVEIKPDKQPVGAHMEGKAAPFSKKVVRVEKGDRLYLFSDGYADQFGGEKGKKLKYKPFKRLILNSASRSLPEQRDLLKREFEKWKGDYEQVDDVVFLAVEI